MIIFANIHDNFFNKIHDKYISFPFIQRSLEKNAKYFTQNITKNTYNRHTSLSSYELGKGTVGRNFRISVIYPKREVEAYRGMVRAIVPGPTVFRRSGFVPGGVSCRSTV